MKKGEHIIPFAEEGWKESAKHDRPEVNLKVSEEEMEEIKYKMDEGIRKRNVPNLHFLNGGRDKSIINKSRFGMLSMLLPMDRQKAKADFMLHWGYCIPEAIDTKKLDVKEEKHFEFFESKKQHRKRKLKKEKEKIVKKYEKREEKK